MGQAQGQKRAPKFKASKYEAPKQRRVTKEQISRATYKDVKLLEKFVSDRGKIRSSLITGITKQEQAKVARLVKVPESLLFFLMLQQVLTNNLTTDDEVNT